MALKQRKEGKKGDTKMLCAECTANGRTMLNVTATLYCYKVALAKHV